MAIFLFLCLASVVGCAQQTESDSSTSITATNIPDQAKPTQQEPTATPQPSQTPTYILSVEDIIATLPTQTAVPTENKSDPFA
ncbi:MAG TPA: hypothetical protein ENN32_09275, partial [Chloroflexi bacterium]|nr:hypothetical protein [Chloroflexota bacterium]